MACLECLTQKLERLVAIYMGLNMNTKEVMEQASKEQTEDRKDYIRHLRKEIGDHANLAVQIINTRCDKEVNNA